MESPVNNQRQPDSTTASTSHDHERRREQAIQFLGAHGADGAGQIAHLNGSLFDHLERTELLLRRWGCSETVSIAGLCHAAYGTDGFPTALVTLEDRDVLSWSRGTRSGGVGIPLRVLRPLFRIPKA